MLAQRAMLLKTNIPRSHPTHRVLGLLQSANQLCLLALTGLQANLQAVALGPEWTGTMQKWGVNHQNRPAAGATQAAAVQSAGLQCRSFCHKPRLQAVHYSYLSAPSSFSRACTRSISRSHICSI